MNFKLMYFVFLLTVFFSCNGGGGGDSSGDGGETTENTESQNSPGAIEICSGLSEGNPLFANRRNLNDTHSLSIDSSCNIFSSICMISGNVTSSTEVDSVTGVIQVEIDNSSSSLGGVNCMPVGDYQCSYEYSAGDEALFLGCNGGEFQAFYLDIEE